jgi:hypothetical protein
MVEPRSVEHNRTPTYNFMLHHPKMAEKRKERYGCNIKTQLLQHLKSSYETTREPAATR